MTGLLAALGAGQLAREDARADFERTLSGDARIRQALLDSEIARYQLLPLALADDRDVIAAEREDALSTPAVQALNQKLERLAKSTGAAAIYLVDRKGLTISSSNWNRPDSFVGSEYGFRRYIRDAQQTGSGRQFALGTVSRKPGLYLAQRTREGGTIVVKLEFDWIERQWRQAGGITFVTNDKGVVFVTSRPDWRFVATVPLGSTARAETLKDSGADAISQRPWTVREDGLLSLPGAQGRHVLVQIPPDTDGWQLNLAMPTGNAIDTRARLVALSTGIATGALGLLVLWLAMRSRRRSARTSELEAAVATRTSELRSEMEQRAELENRAALLREELRLANRLATLGQVTASVAHETSQPVAAIRNYARTARTLIDRSETQEAKDNLHAIDRLAERIGIITAQLRGFARKKSTGPSRTALVDVIEGAQLLLRDRLAGVDATFPALSPDLEVIGDRVRLEQILVNLLQNAIEALGQTAAPHIAIKAQVEPDGGDRVVLRISDNGPGIAPEIAERLFTPFTTSREEGLGLGLVIAQDIAAEFGGSLRLAKRQDSGACFELTLRIAP